MNVLAYLTTLYHLYVLCSLMNFERCEEWQSWTVLGTVPPLSVAEMLSRTQGWRSDVDELEHYEKNEYCDNIEEAFLRDGFMNVTWKCRID
jgi:hypothetical protein